MAGWDVDDGSGLADPSDPSDETGPAETAWPYPHHGSQYGVEGTLAAVDAFAAGARRLSGVRGVLVRAVVALLLAGLVGSVLAAALQGLRLLV